MNIIHRMLACAVLACAIANGASAAQRTFVASYGNDAAPCSRASPCRSFAIAMTTTDPDGEVIVLDSAGYGTVTIAQSVSIIAPPGVYAGISVFSGDGITVDAPAIGVTLRGLTINGQGPSFTHGLQFIQGAWLVIDGCTIQNVGATGVRVSTGRTSISASSIRKSTDSGVVVEADAIATIADSRIESNGSFGVWVFEGANVTIERSVIAKNAGAGVNIYTGSTTTVLAISSSVVSDHSTTGVFVQPLGIGTSANVDVSGNTIARNDHGIHVGSTAGITVKLNASNNQISDSGYAAISAQGVGATVRASGNSMFRATYGILAQLGAIIYSPGNNYVRDNGTDDSTHTADSLL